MVIVGDGFCVQLRLSPPIQILENAVAETIKNYVAIFDLSLDGMNSILIEAFTACRMIPLNKNPGLRPIGVGEVLRRIAGNVIMRVAKEDVINSVGITSSLCGSECRCRSSNSCYA